VELTVAKEAKTVAMIGGIVAIIGWIGVVVVLVLGVILWIDLAGFEPFNLFEAMRITLNAIVGVFTWTLMLAGLGHVMRLFGAYAVAKTDG
jgi:hypothetical protein